MFSYVRNQHLYILVDLFWCVSYRCRLKLTSFETVLSKEQYEKRFQIHRKLFLINNAISITYHDFHSVILHETVISFRETHENRKFMK